jgi:hypothetical protein
MGLYGQKTSSQERQLTKFATRSLQVYYHKGWRCWQRSRRERDWVEALQIFWGGIFSRDKVHLYLEAVPDSKSWIGMDAPSLPDCGY